jgi:hypothetical protein
MQAEVLAARRRDNHPRTGTLLTFQNREGKRLTSMELQVSLFLWSLFLAWLGVRTFRLVYNVFFHPLRAYPGPFGAKATTWWATYIEVWKQESMVDVLFKLHEEFGLSTIY